MGDTWSIQIPLPELVALSALPAKVEELSTTVMQLRRELEAMRMMYTESLGLVNDLRRELRERN